MSLEDHNPLAESGVTMRSDSEQYSPGDELSISPGSTSSSPVILYKPPTIWSMLRGTAINILLPFINGMMLGFGELFAHEAAFRLGWGGTKARTFATRSIASSRTNGIISGHGARVRLFPVGAGAAPMALGSVAASRNLSLWGWGGSSSSKASEQAAEEANRAAMAAQEQQHAASSATDAVTDNVSAPPALTEPSASPLDLTEFGGSAGANAKDILDLSSDQVGYLHALGLDNGSGPTAMMQWVLENIHVTTGAGWTMSIVGSALALRLAMLVPHILQMRNGGRVATMQADPRAVAMKRLTDEAMQGGADAMEKRQQATVISKLLKAEYGVSTLNFLWVFVQFPFTIGLFKLVRQMCNLPVPGMESAGFLWFTDLTVRDPYFVLPALATGLMIMSIQFGQKYMAESQRKMMKPMAAVLGGIGFLFTSFLSAGVNVMGLGFAGATLLTNLVLEIPALRRSLGLLTGPPPPPATVATSSANAAAAAVNVPKGIKYQAPRGAAPPTPTTAEEVAKPLTLTERLNSSYNDAKKGMAQQMGGLGGRMASTDAEKAERNRKELMKKLEDKRQQQEREEFERKYKGKK